jgi:ABC-type uncharacterized transport system permease subunit
MSIVPEYVYMALAIALLDKSNSYIIFFLSLGLSLRKIYTHYMAVRALHVDKGTYM